MHSKFTKLLRNLYELKRFYYFVKITIKAMKKLIDLMVNVLKKRYLKQ